MPLVKPLLTGRDEYLADYSLQEVCEEYKVRLFSKQRPADVFLIENSGIPNESYSFAFRSHIDWVIADGQTMLPLFAVELDGSSHNNQAQKHRDDLKDGLCEHFELPLLRVNAHHLRMYRGTDLLTWLVNQWFLSAAFEQAQDDGFISPLEAFDPIAIIGSPGSPGVFPFWLSRDVRIAIEKCYTDGQIYDPVPSVFIGVDEQGNYRSIGAIRITEDTGVFVSSWSKKQPLFRCVIISDLLKEISAFEVWEKVKLVFSNRQEVLPLKRVKGEIRRFRALYKPAGGSWTGDWDSD